MAETLEERVERLELLVEAMQLFDEKSVELLNILSGDILALQRAIRPKAVGE